MEAKSLRRFRNSDNGPIESLPMFEGSYIHDVNGEGGEEIPDYVPTRSELVQVVRYWHLRRLDDEWFEFLYGRREPNSYRLAIFAERRIHRAAAAIGQEAVDQAIEKAREEFKARVDGRLWDIFENGTDEQWKAVKDQSWREIFEGYAAAALGSLERLEKEPSDFLALVLHDWKDHSRRPVLICSDQSGFTTLLRAAGKFEVETDKSRIRVLMVEQHHSAAGLIRAKREAGEWQFDFPESRPGTVGRQYLEVLTAEIRTLLPSGGYRT